MQAGDVFAGTSTVGLCNPSGCSPTTAVRRGARAAEQGDASSHAGQGAGTILPLFLETSVPTGQEAVTVLWGGLSPGKAYEITYVRLKFHTSRPESFAIYKRGRADGPWVPFQYYSASCHKTYGKQPRHYLRPGEDEQVAFCTDEFSDISPLSGGNVAFSTLEGRPSAYNFDGSPALQVLGGGRGVGAGSPGFGGGEFVLF